MGFKLKRFTFTSKKVLTAFVFLAFVGCSNAISNLELLGSFAEGPTVSGKHEIIIKIGTMTQKLTFKGTCHMFYKKLEVSFDEQSTWIDISTLSDSSSDLDCKDEVYSVKNMNFTSHMSFTTLGESHVFYLRGVAQDKFSGPAKITVTYNPGINSNPHLNLAVSEKFEMNNPVVNSMAVKMNARVTGVGASSSTAEISSPSMKMNVEVSSQ